MNRIELKKTERTPLVILDRENGIIEVRGRSVMENAKMFYEPLFIEWLDDYLNSPAQITTVNLDFEYLNSGSSLWVFQLMKKLEILHKRDIKVIINWFFADEDMLEAGEDLKPLTPIEFNLVDNG
jgi:hypothetical protein